MKLILYEHIFVLEIILSIKTLHFESNILHFILKQVKVLANQLVEEIIETSLTRGQQFVGCFYFTLKSFNKNFINIFYDSLFEPVMVVAILMSFFLIMS